MTFRGRYKNPKRDILKKRFVSLRVSIESMENFRLQSYIIRKMISPAQASGQHFDDFPRRHQNLLFSCNKHHHTVQLC